MVQVSDYDQPPNPAIDKLIDSRPTLPKIKTLTSSQGRTQYLGSLVKLDLD